MFDGPKILENFLELPSIQVREIEFIQVTSYPVLIGMNLIPPTGVIFNDFLVGHVLDEGVHNVHFDAGKRVVDHFLHSDSPLFSFTVIIYQKVTHLGRSSIKVPPF